MTGTFMLLRGMLGMLIEFICSEYIIQEDLTKAARKVGEAKKHESEYLFLQSFPILC